MHKGAMNTVYILYVHCTYKGAMNTVYSLCTYKGGVRQNNNKMSFYTRKCPWSQKINE